MFIYNIYLASQSNIYYNLLNQFINLYGAYFMKKLTIKEIAKLAGVSATAVSFAINKKDGISEETRKKVLGVIKRTNFIPSLNSRRLFFKKSYNISLAIKQSSSPFSDLFYFEITKGVLGKSKEYGYNIVFTDILLEDGIVQVPEIVKQNDTDGIIFFQDTEQSILNEIERLEIPYIIVDAHTSNSNFTYVNADSELSSYTATKYLIGQGHKGIAFIGSSYIPDYYLQAFSGYKNAVQEINMSIPPSWIQINAIDEFSAYRCMENILKSTPIPSAVFCAGDIFAIGAIRCAKDLGFKIPHDISFIGVDDILLSRYIEPALTTIKIDKLQMGILAVELLVKKINSENVESIIVESDKIIERDSVRNMYSNLESKKYKL